MIKNKPIIITTGDTDGIGLEVTIKALRKLPPNFNSEIHVYRSSSAPSFLTEKFPSNGQCIDIPRDDNPVDWVEAATKLCLKKQASALVTGPLSKTLIYKSGRKDIGHTDIFKRLTQVDRVFMTFLGEHFNVLLGSGHVPLSSVPTELNEKLVEAAIQQALSVRKLCKDKESLPIAVLGLNPHSGDDGLLGDDEQIWLNPLIDRLKKTGHNIVGPLVPDAAFIPANWDKYSVFVALYHDQGLIAFKAVHGFDKGIHYSAGLPFVRTSVDHGTAKDIFDRDCANPDSMLNAIEWAEKLATNNNQ